MPERENVNRPSEVRTKPILTMKSKAKRDRRQDDGIARIHRENVESRKRLMRADALGKKSKEFCLADHVGDVIRCPLNLTRVDEPVV